MTSRFWRELPKKMDDSKCWHRVVLKCRGARDTVTSVCQNSDLEDRRYTMATDIDARLREIIRLIREAENTINLSVKTAKNVTPPITTEFVGHCGEALASLIKASQDVFDALPDLADDLLAPEGAARALDPLVVELRNAQPAHTEKILAVLVRFAPPQLMAKLRSAPDGDARA